MARFSKENVFWFLMIVLFSSPYVRWHFYYKHTVPATITIQKNGTASPAEFPFLAVTICNTNKVKRSLVIKVCTQDALTNSFILDTCYETNGTHPAAKKISQWAKEMSQWKNYYSFQKKASQDCSDMITYCKWTSNQTDCLKWFQPVLTSKGICCGINIVHQVIDSGKGWATERFSTEEFVGWTPEYQFKENDPSTALPLRIVSNFTYGLQVGLNVNIEEYFCTKGADPGFEVMLHRPMEIPPFIDGENGFYVPAGKASYVELKPMTLEIDENIAKLDPDVKKCYHTYERTLRFYRIYTYVNCELECLANYTIEYCGCLPKHLPVDFSIKMCGKDEENCVSSMPEHYKESCKCYPSCFMFKHEVSYSVLNFSKEYNDRISDYKKNNMAFLNVYYINASTREYIIVAHPEFIEWSNYANSSSRWSIALIIIILIKKVYNTILSYAVNENQLDMDEAAPGG